ncbi:gliding motility protein GldN [Bernardetia sp. ABR2-2B]|uniref:type IX secretion system ring protein PorN/GldN n=1 Tax=Bernardetia sp. ABR2-2B TaxID=3127472 RepID=UPI0030D392FA
MKKSTKVTLWIKLSIPLFFTLFITSFLKAQEYGDYTNDGYNHKSVRPVHESHIDYQKSLWYRISLRETQNRPFFAEKNEITKLIIDAVKLGIVTPYQNDSLRNHMSREQFLSNIHLHESELNLTEEQIFGCWGGFLDKDLENDDNTWGTELDSSSSDEYYANQFYILETKTNQFFDKNRSRMINDIQTISIILPAEMNPATGLETTIATFSYKELVQSLFRNNSSAIYYNQRNNQAHRNLEEAFDLMLTNGRLIKYQNADDDYIMDIYENYNQTLLVAQNYEATMLEYESNLWEN